MLHHIVWLKAREGTSEAHMADLLADIRALADTIPGVVAIHAGDNVTDRAQGYTHGVVVMLERQVDLQPYLEHPAHVAVGARIRECCEVLALDFVDPA
jgi:hypothetical protein